MQMTITAQHTPAFHDGCVDGCRRYRYCKSTRQQLSTVVSNAYLLCTPILYTRKKKPARDRSYVSEDESSSYLSLRTLADHTLPPSSPLKVSHNHKLELRKSKKTPLVRSAAFSDEGVPPTEKGFWQVPLTASGPGR